jgi:hypothetical protein
MLNIQDGLISAEDQKILNSHVINRNEVKKLNPLESKYTTFFNAKRANINAMVFQNYLKTYHKRNSESNIPLMAIVMKATTKWSKSKLPLMFDKRKVLFEECSEADVKHNTSQMCAPLLCLFSGCSVMVMKTEDIMNRIVNGTTCKFQKLVLKPGVELKNWKCMVIGYI